MTAIASSNGLLILTASLVVQAAAYSANDLAADKIELANAVERAGGGGEIVATLLHDKAAQAVSYDLVFFNADPSATTFTKNSALTVADADLAKICGVHQLTSNIAFAASNITRGEAFRPLPFVLAGGTSLYAALITRGTPTFAATSDVTLQVAVKRL